MATIYEQHEAAFAQVSAYVVMLDGERVATVAFKFPKDGAGRLSAYVHWFGTEMVRGYASGYGYDKRTAAVASAVFKSVICTQGKTLLFAEPGSPAERFSFALRKDDGKYWDECLRDAGFTVLQAV